MYRNLQAEMARENINRRQLSELSGIKYSTISDKLNGRTKFEFEEALAIRDAAFPKMSLEYLFYKGDKQKVSL